MLDDTQYLSGCFEEMESFSQQIKVFCNDPLEGLEFLLKFIYMCWNFSLSRILDYAKFLKEHKKGNFENQQKEEYACDMIRVYLER